MVTAPADRVASFLDLDWPPLAQAPRRGHCRLPRLRVEHLGEARPAADVAFAACERSHGR